MFLFDSSQCFILLNKNNCNAEILLKHVTLGKKNKMGCEICKGVTHILAAGREGYRDGDEMGVWCGSRGREPGREALERKGTGMAVSPGKRGG